MRAAFEIASNEGCRVDLSTSLEKMLQAINQEKKRLDLVERGIITLGNSERLRKSIDQRKRSIEQQVEVLTVIAGVHWRKRDGRQRW
jgi:hypothetical protein